MSILKRLVTTVSATVDRTVAGIENHQAIVDVALRDCRLAVTRAKVRLAGLQKDGGKYRNRITELHSEIELWSERARSVAETDRAKGLECLQRRKQRQSELVVVQNQLKEHERIESGVRNSVEVSLQRVQALQQQRNQMRTRESAAQAQRIMQSMEVKTGGGVDEVLERWEVSVGEAEMMADTLAPLDNGADDLAVSFMCAEESKDLEYELDQLLGTEEGKRND
ncbi:hypothetical protein AB833_29295 [Chromatiales bacterium (ex Bugula neritina AB1)]|nr:hypothetical protein AB833_29295 [Chromatiales bacterium (ex Bugula neritina AB1)]